MSKDELRGFTLRPYLPRSAASPTGSNLEVDSREENRVQWGRVGETPHADVAAGAAEASADDAAAPSSRTDALLDGFSAGTEQRPAQPVQPQADEPQPWAAPPGQAGSGDGRRASIEPTGADFPPRHAGPNGTPGRNEIHLRGRADGVAIEFGAGDWDQMVVQLSTRLEQSASFFRNGQVSLDVGPRAVPELELRQLYDVLSRFGLTLARVRSSSSRTFESALNLGLAGSLDGEDEEQRVEAMPALSNQETLPHFIYRGHLRAGQVLSRRESVVVLGDVNPGAQVISAGDVLVWGRLRGIAFAGAEGDLGAVIGALHLEATQLRIAHLIAISPERGGARFGARNATVRVAEMAYILDDKIVVAPWDQAKQGTTSVLQR